MSPSISSLGINNIQLFIKKTPPEIPVWNFLYSTLLQGLKKKKSAVLNLLPNHYFSFKGYRSFFVPSHPWALGLLSTSHIPSILTR